MGAKRREVERVAIAPPRKEAGESFCALLLCKGDTEERPENVKG